MNASQEPNAEGQISEKDNLSMEEFISQRLAQGEQPAEETESEEVETEDEDTEESVESVEDKGDAEEESDEEESYEEEETEAQGEEIDWMEVDLEVLEKAAKNTKSRSLKDVWKLRSANRILEERLARLEQQGQKPTKDIPADANPFGNLKTIEEIQAKSEELEATLETTDRLLEEYEDYGPDDIIQVGKQQFTKKQIRLANRNAREAIAKYLPAQEKHLLKLANLEKASEVYRATAEKEVPEIADSKSEIGKFYRALVADPLIQQVKEKIPELGSQMEYILAHAVRSIKSQNSKVPTGAGSKLKVKLPASPVSSAGAKGSSQKSKVEALRARYEKTGSQADWQALRLAQMGQ